MKNWLIKFIKQEMWSLYAKCLIKHFEKLQRFVFCAIFDPDNYRYCDIGLWTKYTHGIVQHMFLGIPSIQVGEW